MKLSGHMIFFFFFQVVIYNFLWSQTFFRFFFLILMVIWEIKWSQMIFIYLFATIKTHVWPETHILSKKYICDHYISCMTFKETKLQWPLYFTNDHKNKEKIWKICATIESCKWPWKKVNAEKERKKFPIAIIHDSYKTILEYHI